MPCGKTRRSGKGLRTASSRPARSTSSSTLVVSQRMEQLVACRPAVYFPDLDHRCTYLAFALLISRPSGCRFAAAGTQNIEDPSHQVGDPARGWWLASFSLPAELRARHHRADFPSGLSAGHACRALAATVQSRGRLPRWRGYRTRSRSSGSRLSRGRAGRRCVRRCRVGTATGPYHACNTSPTACVRTWKPGRPAGTTGAMKPRRRPSALGAHQSERGPLPCLPSPPPRLVCRCLRGG